jgi:FkbM family methyltransferase
MAGLIKDDYPLWMRMLTISSKAKRKAFRTFAEYPNAPYRVIIDVGAARGDYAARAAMLFPVTRAVMVEAAISDECGETLFHVNEMADSSSMLHVNRSTSESAFGKSFGTLEEIVVKTLTLDTLYKNENLLSVDLLKVDIQGAEMRLIAGGGEALRKTRAVLLEVNFERFYEGAPLFHEIEATMNAAGFRLRALLEPRLDRSRGFLAYADALYLCRDD